MDLLVRYSLFRIIFPIVTGLFYVEALLLKFNGNEVQRNGILIHITTSILDAKHLLLAKLGSYALYVNMDIVNNTIVLMLYFIFAWVVGMFATFTSEIIIFTYPFRYNIFDGERIENISPFEKRALTFGDFGRVNRDLVEFSEINYVLSNFFASFSVLGFILAHTCLLLVILAIVFLVTLLVIDCNIRHTCAHIFNFLVPIFITVALTVTITVVAPTSRMSILSISITQGIIAFISLIFLFLAISFRVFANKILFYN